MTEKKKSAAIYVGWPVEFDGGKIISDVLWSSRGISRWHEGVDITANSCNSPVKNINTGKLYWYRQNNNSTDYGVI